MRSSTEKIFMIVSHFGSGPIIIILVLMVVWNVGTKPVTMRKDCEEVIYTFYFIQCERTGCSGHSVKKIPRRK